MMNLRITAGAVALMLASMTTVGAQAPGQLAPGQTQTPPANPNVITPPKEGAPLVSGGVYAAGTIFNGGKAYPAGTNLPNQSVPTGSAPTSSNGMYNPSVSQSVYSTSNYTPEVYSQGMAPVYSQSYGSGYYPNGNYGGGFGYGGYGGIGISFGNGGYGGYRGGYGGYGGGRGGYGGGRGGRR